LVADADDAGVDEHLEALDARGVGDVDVRVANRRAVLRRLRDGVDLGVNRAKAVLLDLAARGVRLIDKAARLGAVRPAGRRAVVARGQDVLVAHDHRAHLGARARRALRHLARDRQKILIPAQPLAHDPLPRTCTRAGNGTTRRTRGADGRWTCQATG